jgi:hypothetical protein
MHQFGFHLFREEYLFISKRAGINQSLRDEIVVIKKK